MEITAHQALLLLDSVLCKMDTVRNAQKKGKIDRKEAAKIYYDYADLLVLLTHEKARLLEEESK